MHEPNRWKMNRAGLFNFWYYHTMEVFDFSDGKLLLRGSNGSGKSVTMQSLLPVLLDGRRSPERLDPFGSRARKMEDYLLGEKEVGGRDERTGYLFIEYKRAGTEQYITTGIGLQARRHKQMNFWGFAITDNRRIGKDFDLFEMETQAGKKQQIPLSRTQLENRIAGGGEVVRSQSEYMQLVNKLLFGFETEDAFADLIQLLLQLRSPKLSKDFKPTVIYDILQKALPPLTDEDLRHLSDTIEHMDGVKQQIEQLERERSALTKLNKHYDDYNQFKLAEKAEAYQKTKRRLAAVEKEMAIKKRETDKLTAEIQVLQERTASLQQAKLVAEEKRTRLQGHRVWQIEEERDSKLQQLSVYRKEMIAKEERLENKKRQERTAKEHLLEMEDAVEKAELDAKQALDELQESAEQAAFTGHAVNSQDFTRLRNAEYDFVVWDAEAERHDDFLSETMEQLRQIDRLREELAEREKKQADKQLELDRLKMEAEDWVKVFQTDKQNQLDAIHLWSKRHPFFGVSEPLLSQTARWLDDLYEPYEYRTIREPFWKLNEEYRAGLYEKKVEAMTAKDQLLHQVAEKEDEKRELQLQKDPEPVFRSRATREARSHLALAGCRISPFYEAVEFKPDIPEETRNRLEAAILDAGILDALIVENMDAAGIQHDRILVPSPNLMAHTLADYLEPDIEDEKLSRSVVDDVLRSIVVGEKVAGGGSAFSVSEDGTYVVGLLEGHASPVDAVRFIGKNARERFRQQEISRLTEEIEQLHTKVNEWDQTIQTVDSLFETAERAMAEFPMDDDLSTSFQEIKKKQLEMNAVQKDLLALEEEMRKRKQAFLELKRSVDMKTRELDLEQTSSAYAEARAEMRHYRKTLRKLELTHKEEQNLRANLLRVSERLEEIIYEVDELQGELNTILFKIDQLDQSIHEIEEQLKLQGVEEIRKEIGAVRQLLAEIENELDDNKVQLPKKEVRVETLYNQISVEEQEASFLTHLSEAWKTSFSKELAYGFVLETEEEISLEEQMALVADQYAPFLAQKDISKIEENLTKMYNEQFSNLMEYRMQEINERPESQQWEQADWTEAQQIEYANWQRASTRRLIQLDFQGKRVSPYFILHSIAADYERQSHALEEEDRRLYEEILFDSVGNMLRSRITRAQNWAEKMDKLMRQNDSSSGLSFSIQWKPRSAENEVELDTNELVDLLRRDPRLMKETDLNRIIEHFRSKIDRAKEEVDQQGEGKTLLQVLKSVLDYRYWFSFVLYYKREREQRKELTNFAFDKFSGGEKAMAMYIPLFTACFSRYQEAAPTAPHIITLDEAFAGVDENNISMMFGIVEELGFDFIMNSQVLWGDYETVSALSICELVRPKNADFVSVVKYRWDGVKRTEVQSEMALSGMDGD